MAFIVVPTFLLVTLNLFGLVYAAEPASFLLGLGVAQAERQRKKENVRKRETRAQREQGYLLQYCPARNIFVARVGLIQKFRLCLRKPSV